MYFYPVYPCYPMYTPYVNNIMPRQYPSVDPELFNQSAIEMRKLMSDASLILEKLATFKEFDTKVMDAAQQSNMDEVEKLIKSVGISSEVKVNFNPDNIRLEFISDTNDTECCRLSIAIRWR